MDISVVIPHFGDPKPTIDLVAALRAEGLPPTWELIVVDDASPVPLVEARGARIVRRAVNGGFGSAVNSGAAEARGHLMLVLNSDLVVRSKALDDLVRLSAELQPAVISPRVLSPSGEYQWVGRRFPTLAFWAAEWFTPLARYRGRPWWHRAVGHLTDGSSRAPAEVDWVVGAAMLIPLAEFRSVHGFDESYFMNSEEVDLQRRLKSIGVPSFELGQVEVLHEGGGSSDPLRRRHWLVQSRLQYSRKWTGTALVPQLVLSGVTALNFAFNVIRRASGSKVAPIRTAREELGFLWTPIPERRVASSATAVTTP